VQLELVDVVQLVYINNANVKQLVDVPGTVGIREAELQMEVEQKNALRLTEKSRTPRSTAVRSPRRRCTSSRRSWGFHLNQYTAQANAAAASSDDGFLQCLSASIPNQLVFTQSSPSFTPLLKSSIRNPKLFTPSTVRPLYVVTPTNASHVQAAVVCGRRNGVRLHVRSGGHDYEGLSYRSEGAGEAFAVLDLSNLRAVRVDAQASTAWVDSGATLGEL
jgi:hypothetical protein